MKIYAFIDSQNLNLAVRLAGWILDFKKFRIHLKDKYNVCKAYIFIGYTSKNKGLYKFLRKAGYTVVFKPTLRGENGAIKGNCDAELVLHCVSECVNFDKAIIVSGDGDFYCLVKYLKEKGKLLSIGIPNRDKYSALFREFSNNRFYITDQRKFLEYKKERH
ncbi:MAG: hypothetical protein US92_C0001G0185 [Candidatus Peregrinibacteria bacterium GW2011_GWA2_38_36]|nr:MAG: hypothetical protein US92_C0001G0185 [Candidatus Peregrinibacteria bacterium GW2011_GWA2_38_36]